MILGLAVGLAAGFGFATWLAKRRQDRLAKLLSFAAHEINSPLSSLKLTSAGFLQDLYGPISEQHRPWLSMIREQTARCEALVGDLRDFIHLELHKDFGLHLEPTDVREVLAEAVEEMSTGFGRADAPLESSLPPSLPEVEADQDRLRRVFLAMLSHAKKFRAKGTVRVTARDEEGWIVVLIEFDSLAIPHDARGGMLDLWQPAAARDGRGTSCVGLGLGFAHALAKLHGGRLEFTMDDANACRIVFRLPTKGAA